jgi:HEAT repeat protein
MGRCLLLLLATVAIVGAGFLVAFKEPTQDGRTLTEWLDEIASGDEERRALALEMIHEMGPKAGPALVRHVDRTFRRARLLSMRPFAVALEWLVGRGILSGKFVRDLDKRFGATLVALDSLGADAALSPTRLTSLLKRDRYAGAFLLARLRPGTVGQGSAERAIPLLVAELSGREPDLRDAVDGALRAIGVAALPALKTALTNQHETARARAAKLIGEIGKDQPIAGVLLPVLNDASAEVRRAAAGALDYAHPLSSEAKAGLFALLKDEDAMVRMVAACSLGEFDANGDEAFRTVRAEATDPASPVRVEAIVALGKFTRRSSEVVECILSELERSYAIASAAKAESDTERRERIEWHEGYFRVNAVRTLRDSPRQGLEFSERALPLLIRAVDDDEDWVRQPAIDAMAKLGPAARVAAPELMGKVRAGEGDLSAAAIRALATIAPEHPEVRGVLTSAMADGDARIRLAAAEAIPKLPSVQAAMAALESGLNDRSHAVRRACAHALGQTRSIPGNVRVDLERLAENDPFPSVRRAARAALTSVSEK